MSAAWLRAARGLEALEKAADERGIQLPGKTPGHDDALRRNTRKLTLMDIKGREVHVSFAGTISELHETVNTRAGYYVPKSSCELMPPTFKIGGNIMIGSKVKVEFEGVGGITRLDMDVNGVSVVVTENLCDVLPPKLLPESYTS